MAAAASNDVWAVGFKIGPDNPDFGLQLIEHWNGTSWSVDTTGPEIEGDSLSGVTVVSSNNVWAVGAAGGNALVEHWDGTSWSIVSNSVIAGAGRLSAVSADSANDVWAVGQAGNGGPPILHFNGTTWSQVATPNPSMEANSVTALSPTNVWAVGTVQTLFNQRPKTRLEPSRVVLYPFAQHSVRHGDPLEHHGGRYDAPPLASRHRLQILGT